MGNNDALSAYNLALSAYLKANTTANPATLDPSLVLNFAQSHNLFTAIAAGTRVKESSSNGFVIQNNGNGNGKYDILFEDSGGFPGDALQISESSASFSNR